MRKTGEIKNCLTCNKEMYVPAWWSKSGGGKYCSRECHGKSMIGVVRNSIKEESVCQYCKNVFKIFPSRLKDKKTKRGVYCSRKCSNEAKIVSSMYEGNNNWKGDMVGYCGIHDWMASHYGRPSKCEVCGTDDKNKKYHWANLSGKYKRDRNDFKRMCVSCHKKYDLSRIKLQNEKSVL